MPIMNILNIYRVAQPGGKFIQFDFIQLPPLQYYRVPAGGVVVWAVSHRKAEADMNCVCV